MRHIAVWSIFLYLTVSSLLAPIDRQAQLGVNLTAPRAGQAVQGLVEISGNVDVEGFSAYQLDFSFADDPTATWFLIARSEQPVADGPLGEWDTSALTDGSYALRLIVERQGESPIVITVDQLRVRYYSPIETNTPAATATPIPGQLPTATATPLPPAAPAATPLASNPASMQSSQISRALTGGIALALIALSALGLYNTARKRARK